MTALPGRPDEQQGRKSHKNGFILASFCIFLASAVVVQAQDAAPTATAEAVHIALTKANEAPPAPAPTFTARFSTDQLLLLLDQKVNLLPLPFQLDGAAQAYSEALLDVDMAAVAGELQPFLDVHFGERFSPDSSLIVVPVPQDEQVEVEAPDLPGGKYRGPSDRVIGFLVHDVNQTEYLNIAVRTMQAARKLIDSGDPAVNRSSPSFKMLAANRELDALRASAAGDRSVEAERQEVRQRVGEQLGVYDPATGKFEGEPKWVKESRRFSYVVKDGQFIEKLQPLVKRINREIQLAGFPSPSSIDHPGIHFDDDLEDVEILLPRPMLETFLREADRLERRMAEDAMISIEAVRLTDRDIVTAAVASRLRANMLGVHDNSYGNAKGVVKQLGINTLLAVANRELQVANIQEIAAGNLPEGTPAITLPSVELPNLEFNRTTTVVGGDFSVGADGVFFDGSEQTYGFQYTSPDGVTHDLAFDVVDNLRDFWERIERNLIVHKIKKTESRELFSVPVGPETKTFEGIAALISQENQQRVVATGTGAISEISATAGTWLVIKDFEIAPIPGSSTALSEEDRQALRARVLLTMFLRDPAVSVEDKIRLVELDSRDTLHRELAEMYNLYKNRPTRSGVHADTYETVFDERREKTVEIAEIEKKERNSQITLTFYSSQGNILTSVGETALGDANDLTSFTTELRPNIVTPISSFFTKGASGSTSTSPLTTLPKGEDSDESKTMTHLVIRARFPTSEREEKDREEGRYLGYFDLPVGRVPLSIDELPSLSSSEHPLDRLAALRVGVTFEALREENIREPFAILNPNRIAGDVPLPIWEMCSTRLLMNKLMLANSPANIQDFGPRYRQRFNVEVRSLLEYDEVFFDAPNVALQNMAHWNDPGRIVQALNNSTDRFALSRLIDMIDELGASLITDEFIAEYLAVSEPGGLFGDSLRPLTREEIQILRRDVASHFLRFEEAYGDAFLEAVSILLNLGTYLPASEAELHDGPFNGYSDLVLFDVGASDLAMKKTMQKAHADFLLLKAGGYKGKLFEASIQTLGDLEPRSRQFVVHGRDILQRRKIQAFTYR